MEKKGKENKAEKKREMGELKASPKIYYEVIDVHLLHTKAYICSEKGKLQNNMKQQNYSEGRTEKNKKQSRFDKKQEQTISLCTVIFAIIAKNTGIAKIEIFAMHSNFRYIAKIRYDREISLS